MIQFMILKQRLCRQTGVILKVYFCKKQGITFYKNIADVLERSNWVAAASSLVNRISVALSQYFWAILSL